MKTVQLAISVGWLVIAMISRLRHMEQEAILAMLVAIYFVIPATRNEK